LLVQEDKEYNKNWKEATDNRRPVRALYKQAAGDKMLSGMRGLSSGEIPMRGLLAILAPGLLIAGCGKSARNAGEDGGTDMKTLTVTSTAFKNGEPIPKKYAYRPEGDNVSPPLAWSGAPAGVQSYALICDDPDAKGPEPWVHWVIFDIPANRTSLGENEGGKQPGGWDGINSFNERGWGGPLPPPGKVHHYYFKVFALDARMGPAEVTKPPTMTKSELLSAMKGHVIAKGEIMGTYERK
jgi:Raf kinase inhibitor-like YbhB/YbcL family protein